ncbi:MAG: hypothetical protein CMC08_08445 [Flavobacteriaceae bacterium]|nr:hypothetical protein [Flavobacteriaceae bacterium]
MTQQTKTNNISSKTHKRLSVQVSLTGLSFLAYTEDRQIDAFIEVAIGRSATPEELLDNLQQTLIEHKELQGPFEKVMITYSTNIYTIVPAALFDESKASDYLKFNSKILGNDYIAHDWVENHEMVTVYVPFMNINNFLFERFGSFEYYHSTTHLLQYVLRKNKNTEVANVYIQIEQGFFNLVVTKSGKLQLCNSFSYHSPEDFLYYILFAFEQLELNPDTVSTFVIGNITDEHDLYEIAYKYIRNIAFVEDSCMPRIGNDVPPHFNFIQKLALQCV